MPSSFHIQRESGGGGRRAYLLNIYYVPGALVPHGIFVPHGILFSSRPSQTDFVKEVLVNSLGEKQAWPRFSWKEKRKLGEEAVLQKTPLTA